jgi:hypothetical protein
VRAPPGFFLCYRRTDAGWAAALYGALVKVHGPGRVFKDITSLPLAADWRQAVTGGLDRTTHVLALVGPQWMDGVDAGVADANGSASATFRVPQSPDGPWTVTAHQQQSVKYDDALSP